MILVDTSIWIDHLRSGDEGLSKLLLADAVIVHPFVFGEIALGSLTDRAATLRELARIPAAPMASNDEVFSMIDRRRLYSRGIGFVDAHLLASTLMTGTDLLWTRDRRLAGIADELGIDATAP